MSDFQPAATPSPASRFVGRAHELQQLGVAWGEARSGRAGIFLIHGEPGIGKSRLAEEIGAQAVAQGGRIAWGRCREDGDTPTLWPWIQIVRHLIGASDASLTTRLHPHVRNVLSQLVPEIEAPDTGQALLGHPRSLEHIQISDALTAFLRDAAIAAPLVLVVDDLHAADGPSLRALEYLADTLRTERILLVGTYREIDAMRVPNRLEPLLRVARRGHHIPLHGLDSSEVGRFLEVAFSRQPAPAVVEALHAITEGNPFFLDEVARLLLATPRLAKLDHVPAGGLPIPHAVRDAVQQRLAPLSAETARTLRIASVIGRRFPLAILAEVCGQGREEILARLDEAYALALVDRPDTATAEFRFHHALIHEALYERTASAERAQLHIRIGETLLLAHQANGDARIAEIALHFFRGAALTPPHRVIEMAVAAARQAHSLSAFEEAALWYERARSVLPDSDRGSTADIELLLSLGEARAKAWSTDSAREAFREAIRLARSPLSHLWHTDGAPGLPFAPAQATAPAASRPTASARLFARACLGLSAMGIGMPRGIVDPELVELLETALSGLHPGDEPALRARLLARLALELYFSSESAQRHELMQQAQALAECCADPLAVAHVNNARLVTEWDTAALADRLTYAAEAIASAVALGERDLELRARVFRVMDLVELGDATAWSDEIEQVGRMAALDRQPAYGSTLTTLRIMTALWRGHFTEAEALCLAQLAESSGWEDPYVRISTQLQLLWLRLLQGRSGEMEPLVRLAASQPGVPAEGTAAFALLLWALGHDTEARPLYQGLATAEFSSLARQRHLSSILAWLVELALAYGSPQELRALHAYVAAQEPHFLHFATRLCFGPSSYFLGRIEARLGDAPSARHHLQDAIEAATRTGGSPVRAWSQLELAKLLLSQPIAHEDLARARDLVAAAATTAVELDMPPLARACAATLGALARTHDTESCNVTTGAAEEELAQESQMAAAVGTSARVVPLPRRDRPTARPRPVAVSKSERVDEDVALLRLEGGMWTVRWAAASLRLRRSKGLRYLAELLRAPGREIHVTDLVALDQEPPETLARELPRRGSEALQNEGMHLGAAESGGDPLDSRARSAYRHRLEELRGELDEATAFNDSGRATRLREEMELIATELSRGLGLGGRSRRGSQQAERNRLNVTRALQAAIRQIATGHPGLGQHLRHTIHTGTFCRYDPGDKPALRWQF